MRAEFREGFEKTAFVGTALKAGKIVGGRLIGRSGRQALRSGLRKARVYGSRILGPSGRKHIQTARSVGAKIPGGVKKTMGMGGKALNYGLIGMTAMDVGDQVSSQINKAPGASMRGSSFYSKVR